MYYLESLGVSSGHVIKRKHGAALPLFFDVYKQAEDCARGFWKRDQSEENMLKDQMHLDLFREGCTEHHGLSDAFVRHGVLLDDASNLGLKTHVQHAVSLVQDQIAAVIKKEKVSH